MSLPFSLSRGRCGSRSWTAITINKQIGGVGNNIRAARKGKLKAEVVQADGSKTTKILSPAKYYSKEAQENLLSLTAEMTAGARLSSTTNMFDRRIKTRDGWINGVDIVPIPSEHAKEERALVAANATRDVNECHRQLGHPNNQVTRATAKAFGIKLMGYVLYVKGVPVCWKSKAKGSVTLSSTEADWIALSEAKKEIILVLQLCTGKFGNRGKSFNYSTSALIILEQFSCPKTSIRQVVQNTLMCALNTSTNIVKTEW